MKEAMWSVTPDGSFTAFERDEPDQLVLITPESDLTALRDRLWVQFVGKKVRMNAIYEWLVGGVVSEEALTPGAARIQESWDA